MPRFKNPKPLQHSFVKFDSEVSNKNAENEKRCTTPLAAAAADMDCDVEEKMRIERSLSPSSSIALSENKETESLRLSPEPISSLDEKDYGFEKRNTEYERTEKASKKDVVSDHLTDNTLKKNEAPNQFEMAVISDKKRRPATNHLNPNLLSWLHKRYMLRDNAKTSASQVIRHYEREFRDSELYVPLQSYQVGQLLRRLFPGLQRCKITVNGKRVWVYKHLSLRTEGTSDTMAEKDYYPSIADIEREKELAAKGFPVAKINFRSLKEEHEKAMSSKSSERNEAQKRVKQSAILYNLLYPHSNSAKSNTASTFRQINSKTVLLKTKPVPTRNPRDEAIVKWLKENYEYAQGYFVKSLNVLKKYNEGRQTEVRYLSQVGRIIKYVFPNARHLRRSLKGGKREWIYHNIRPKDYSEQDIWKGSTKNLSPPHPLLKQPSRPSLVPISQFSMKKIADGKFSSQALDESLSFLDRDNMASRESAMTDSDSFPSEEGIVFPTGMKSESCTPSPASLQDFSSIFYKSENLDSDNPDNFTEEDRSWSPYQGSNNLTESNTPELSQTSEDFSGKNGEKLKKSALEAQISRLKCEKSDNSSSFPRDLSMQNKNSQAEDLSMPDTSLAAAKRKSPSLEEEETSNKRKALDPEDEENLNSDSKKIRSNAVEHSYSFGNIIDSDLRIKDFVRTHTQSAPTTSPYDKRSLQNDPIPVPTSFQRNRTDDSVIQWEDLSMCDAHRYGWTLTPTLNNEIPPNYIEWILFEGQLLRDGQRVFRELKIYDDWSVSIHAMGKKVHPDELGGITDLSRTTKSVSKVFATLAGARSCRGLPALCLSDLCVHGVVVAKTEIWSSRESNCEELRHRAINCQVLYCGNEESCSKCYRVIRMHTHNTSASGSNGYAAKESRFRTNNSL